MMNCPNRPRGNACLSDRDAEGDASFDPRCIYCRRKESERRKDVCAGSVWFQETHEFYPCKYRSIITRDGIGYCGRHDPEKNKTEAIQHRFRLEKEGHHRNSNPR